MIIAQPEQDQSAAGINNVSKYLSINGYFFLTLEVS